MSVQAETRTGTPAVPVRTSAVILDGRQMCLIHRRRSAGDQYSVPGGLVNDMEEIPAALARELHEELDLDLNEVPEAPQLRWVGFVAAFRERLLPGSRNTELFQSGH
ncbi:NUDIX hydrolase [Streptomyces sp. NPDC054838]